MQCSIAISISIVPVSTSFIYPADASVVLSVLMRFEFSVLFCFFVVVTFVSVFVPTWHADQNFNDLASNAASALFLSPRACRSSKMTLFRSNPLLVISWTSASLNVSVGSTQLSSVGASDDPEPLAVERH